MEMQAGVRRVDPFAEAQHDALFVGLYAVDRGRQPAEDDDQRNQDPPALSKARRSEDRAKTLAQHSADAESDKTRSQERPTSRPSAPQALKTLTVASNSCGPGRPQHCFRSILANGETLLQHEAGAGAQLFGFALQLAAGGQNVAAARRAHRARIARVEHDLGKALDGLPVRAFVGAARPGIERNEVDLGRQALEQPYQRAAPRRESR